jgi:hypothetical protein
MTYAQWKARVDWVIKDRGLKPMATFINWGAYYNCNYTPEAAVYDAYQGAGFSRKQGQGWR